MTAIVSSKLLKVTATLFISTILALMLSVNAFAVGSSNSGGNEDAGNGSSQESNASDNGQGGESAEDKQARRQNACKAGKTKMEQIQNRLTASGESFQNKVNGVLERLDAYIAKKGLNSAEMTRLRVQIDEQKEGAQNAIQNTKQKQGNVDCDNPDGVVATMNTYRNQVNSFKTEAKEYVSSIKAYVQEVKAVAAAATEEGA